MLLMALGTVVTHDHAPLVIPRESALGLAGQLAFEEAYWTKLPFFRFSGVAKFVLPPLKMLPPFRASSCELAAVRGE